MIKQQPEEKVSSRNFWRILFSLITHLLREVSINKYVYIILLIIENIQIMYYSLHCHFGFLWKTSVLTGAQSIMKYFEATAYIQSISGFYIVLLNVTLAALFLSLALIVRETLRISQNPKQTTEVSSLDKYSISFINGFIIGFKTILHIPIFFLIFACLSNSNYNNDFSNQVYYIQLVFCILAFILFVVYMIMFNIFYTSSEPFSTYLPASFNCYEDIFKASVKTMLPTYIILDPNNSYGQTFCIIAVLVYGGWIIVAYRNFELFKYPYRILYSNQPVVCFWVTIFAVYQSFVPLESEGFFYLMISIPVVIVAWHWLLDRKYCLILQQDTSLITNENDFIPYLLEIIKLVQESHITKNDFKLRSWLSTHYEKCKCNNCYCAEFINQTVNKLEINKTDWYRLLKDIILEQINQYPQNANFSIFLSYIYLKRLNNKYKSIYYLNKLEMQPLSILQQLKAYVFMKEIQYYIEGENDKNKEKKNSTIKNIYLFNREFSDFRTKIFECCNKYLEFWKELQEDHPEGIKLYETGESINKDWLDIRAKYQYLQTLNPNNIKMLIQFTTFLQYIRGIDDLELKNRIVQLRKLSHKKGKYLEVEKAKYSDNAQTGIIVISANQLNLGEILYSNSFILQTLGYTNKQLLHSNIDIVIPVALRDGHNEKMKDHIQGSEETKEGVEKTVYMLHKNNHIIFASFMIETLPDISAGVCLVGYMSILPIEPLYTICDSSGRIYGMSRKFIDVFEVQGFQKMNIFDMLPDINFKEVNLNSKIKTNLRVEKQTKLKTLQKIQSIVNEVTATVIERKKIYRQIQLMSIMFESAKYNPNLSLSSHMDDVLLSKQEIIKEAEDLKDIDKELDSQEKEFLMVKEIIQGNKEPKRLQYLRKIGYLVLISLIVLSCISLPLFFTKIGYANQYLLIDASIHNIRTYVIDLSYLTRLMNMITYLYSSISYVYSMFGTNINIFINELASVNSEFNYYTGMQQIISSRGGTISNSNTNYYSIATNSYIFSLALTPLNACILQYLSAASNIQNATVSNFNFTTQLSNLSYPLTVVQSNFIQMRFNELYSITPTLMNSRSDIDSYYQCTLLGCDYSSLIIMIIGIVLILLLCAAAIFYNITFAKIGLQVLSLFGHVNKAGIDLEIQQINEYLTFNFVDIIGYPQHEEWLDKQPRTAEKRVSIQDALLNRAASRLFTPFESESARESECEQLAPNKKLSNAKNEKKEESPKVKEVELMHTKITRRWTIIAKYLLFGLALLAYSISDYVVIKSTLTKYVQSNQDYDQLNQRIELLEMSRIYLMQSYFDNSSFMSQPTLDTMLLNYVNQLYNVERYLANLNTPFPQFQSLVNMMNSIDLCANLNLYSTYSSYNLTQLDCLSYNNGALQGGLKSAIVSWIDLLQSLRITNFDSSTNLTGILMSTQFQQLLYMVNYIIGAIEYERFSYTQIMSQQISSIQGIFITKLVLYIFAVVGMAVIWQIFIRDLESMIEKIKGLILIITFRKIEKNPNLKKQILQNRIFVSFK